VVALNRSRTFAEILAEEAPLPDDRALELLRGAATALDAFHARSSVHGSLGAETLRERSDGRVVLDPPDETATLSRSGERTRYWSPQRKAGERARRTDDLFALGVVARECLSERRSSDPTPEQIDRRTVRSDDPGSTGLVPSVDRVLARQLATAPSERYASGAALLQDLERAVRGWSDTSPDSAAHSNSRAEPVVPSARSTSPASSWSRRFGGYERRRAAPGARLTLAELPDSHRRIAQPARRRITRRNDYPDLPLPGVAVLAIVAVLCSVYLFPLYFMLFRHL